MSPADLSIAVIGGGPAGLKAAEVAAEAGAKVTLYEAKRSVGRKFLIAGKSGLNLTSDEDFESFVARYSSSSDNDPMDTTWTSLLTDFDNSATRQWASSLGIDTFVSSAKKVFPEQMKAAPLLRRWLSKIKALGVEVKVNHKLTQIDGTSLHFSTPEGDVSHQHDRIILALGGGSWPITGSDGAWVRIMEQLQVETIPLSAANCGWHADWPDTLLKDAEGLPIKNIEIFSGAKKHHGEVVITRYGLEGGPIYRLGPQIRQTHQIQIDLKPTFTEQQLLKKMESVKKNFLSEARPRWKLNPASFAILQHHHQADTLTLEALATLVKNCPITLTHPRPIDEAISSAGGICWSELNDQLQLKKHPHIFIAGEMIDWEAPTGGFLLQGCFATGRRAALAAASWYR